ncbi:MAG: hypothetical protein ACE5DX_05780 [Candidatus Dojkabacteria bacterium]
MKKPVIIQFEADDNYVTVVDLIAFNMGLEINAVASSVKQAKALFEQIESGKLKPEIVIVSSFLQKNHLDGKQVAEKIRQLSPKAKIIAYSVIPDTDWGDYLAIKSGKDTNKTLVQILVDLTGNDFNMDNSG